MNKSPKTIKNHLDANHLIDSFNHWRKKSRTSDDKLAWDVVSDSGTAWKVNPEAFMEFHRGLSQVEKKAVPAFLKRINASVINKGQAEKLRNNPLFSQVNNAMTKVSGGQHAQDIRHAAYSTADGMSFVGDRKFTKFVNFSFKAGKHSNGLPVSVVNIDQIADILGY